MRRFPGQPYTNEELDEFASALRATNNNISQAAVLLGISRGAARQRNQRLKERRPRAFEIPDLPDDTPTAEEIIHRRQNIWKHRKAADDARKFIEIKMNVEGPYAVAFMGDWHCDNPGTNIDLLMEHIDIIRDTDNMFAILIGDLQDGWLTRGRLAEQWAHQGVTAKEAQVLAEHFIENLAHNLLAIVEGNHDSWVRGVSGISAYEWVCSRNQIIAEPDGVRLGLKTPDENIMKINARHDHPGRSQYNPAHGPAKAARFYGFDDDIIIAGHTHEYAYLPLMNGATGKVSHAIRVASYKHIDKYAKERGFPDHCISECVVAIYDPNEKDYRHRILIEPNPARAAKILKMLRNET